MIELISTAFSWFIHLDVHLQELIASYGTLTYAILFLIIFCETGLVVTPVLPGDSLLFAVGVFAANGSLSLPVVLISLSIAAILGDTMNYAIGSYVAPRMVEGRFTWFVKQKHIDYTNKFFDQYGPETIIIARFVPIVRTFAPFVAGAGTMKYSKFLAYNVFGALLWIHLLTLGGYFFGNVPVVKENFSLVVVAIIVVSLIPAVVQVIRAWRESRAETQP